MELNLTTQTLYIISSFAVVLTLILYYDLERKEIFKDPSFYMALLINFFIPPVTSYIIGYWIFVKSGESSPHKNVWFWIVVSIVALLMGYVLLPEFEANGLLPSF